MSVDLTAAYLVCRHLEQNGLYHRDKVDEGYNLHKRSPSYREAHKVQRRSGAGSVLDADSHYDLDLFRVLRETGCTVEEAGEVALRTGFWRYRLAEEYGYDPMFREGWYSVPQLYIPSEGLATETYKAYARGENRRQDVVEAIASTTDPESYVDEADRLFEECPASETAMFRVLDSEVRFTTGVRSLQLYAEKKVPTILEDSLL